MLDWPWPTIWIALAAVGTLAAFLATFRYVRLTARMVEREERPLLRVERIPSAGNRAVRVSNIGRGVALSAAVASTLDRRSQVEPIGILGPAEDKEVQSSILRDDLPTAACFVYYQDVTGRWHATKLVPWAARFKTQFVGIVADRMVPEEVKKEAEVLSAIDILEPATKPNWIRRLLRPDPKE